MDKERFDDIAKVLALKFSRRGATALLAVLPPLAFAVPEDAAAKRKKRKKKGARCKTVRQSCTGSNCCGGLGCGDNGCDGGKVCYQHQGGGCSEDCDCGGDLKCSERSFTCQHCSYPETPCVWTDECCLDTSICGDNGCGSGHAVCCQWEIGSFCYDDCDCCAELGCFGNACLPFLTADGAPRRTQATGETVKQPPAKWSKR